MNYFSPRTVAERYSKGRPDFHANTIKHIKDFLRLDNKVEKALDIACGTGLSTKALLSIATNVFGTDISQEMLKLAPHTDKINYSIAPAEQQPFPDNHFDLITVSSGVHWFHIDMFLKETNRLLKSNSWLVLYENYISEMVDNEKFNKWYSDIFIKRFPAAPRNDKYDWSNKNLHSKNLNLVTEETFKNVVLLNKTQLASYFISQSNIIAPVENGQITYKEVEDWLNNELANFFDTDETARTINYGNWVKFIQKAN
jgi:ubiquinone/menaquinone biosynthesis C-methylase UbiE